MIKEVKTMKSSVNFKSNRFDSCLLNFDQMCLKYCMYCSSVLTDTKMVSSHCGFSSLYCSKKLIITRN